MPYLHDIRGSITNDWISKKKRKTKKERKIVQMKNLKNTKWKINA